MRHSRIAGWDERVAFSGYKRASSAYCMNRQVELSSDVPVDLPRWTLSHRNAYPLPTRFPISSQLPTHNNVEVVPPREAQRRICTEFQINSRDLRAYRSSQHEQLASIPPFKGNDGFNVPFLRCRIHEYLPKVVCRYEATDWMIIPL